MTTRRRFAETLRYGRPDRVPYFEEGLRDDVLKAWRAQGLAADADLGAMFQTDRWERIEVDVEPRPKLEKWPTSRRGLQALRRRLDPSDPGRLPDNWQRRVKAWRRRRHVLQLPVHRGFFLAMGVRTWARFIEVCYQLADAPALVHEIMAIHAEFCARLAGRILQDVKVDFASFSEPIGGNNDPLLSPRTYERFALSSYQPVMDVLRKGGVETLVFVTYANARALLPTVLDAGFDCLWACEARTRAMDYRALRRQFGPSLRLIGGIDVNVLLRGKAAIRREVERKVPPLLAQGGYIPLADGRVRPNVPLEHYLYYRRLLEKVTQA